ncbi:MAG: RluA family pseudouridine synthase [bacterium]
MRGDLTVLFEDDWLFVVDKPSGLLVHRGYGADEVTLVEMVARRLGRAHPVHRLDRATSGVLVFAKSGDIARDLQLQFQDGLVTKRYLALARGHIREPVTVDHPVPKDEGGERIDAVTDLVPLAHLDCAPRDVTWVEARPKTGRFHQIRRHLKHISHPVIGDSNYGKGPLNREFAAVHGLARLALHAQGLRLVHPGDARPLVFEAPLPDDLLLPLRSMGFDFLPNDLGDLV